MFFDTSFLCSYNHQMRDLLLVDCECYDLYRTREAFMRTVIAERRSYMACLCYCSKSRKRINHRTVPIVLGSYIDYTIRGYEAVRECREQWGAVILKGALKIYASFSTFDALSLHVRETRSLKSIDWFTYVPSSPPLQQQQQQHQALLRAVAAATAKPGGRGRRCASSKSGAGTTSAAAVLNNTFDRGAVDGLAINYRDNLVTWTYRYATYDSRESDEWIHLLRRSNPFDNGAQRHAQADDYVEMFETMLRYPYNMNDLKNRQFLNGATIISKYIAHDLNKRRKKKGVGCLKMSVAFEQGTLFQALSKRSFNDSDEWCRNYPQNYDNTLHEGRSNKTSILLPNITRASNDAVRNSNALAFPSDAVGYFCMLNTKDLKSAGEQNVLADFVTTSEETNPRVLYSYLRSVNTGRGETLVIDGYITPFRREWTLADLVELKRHHGHVTTKYYSPYVMFCTRNSIPIKYSDEHDAFFSPAETTRYGIRYPEAEILSTAAKQLGVINLRKTAPAKATVSINNLKGSVANVTSEFHRELMQNSLGITCYMCIDDRLYAEMASWAVLSRGNDTAHFERVRGEVFRRFGLDQDPAPPSRTHVGKAMRALDRLYPADDLLFACRKTSGSRFELVRRTDLCDSVRRYRELIFGRPQYETQGVFNLRLYAMFGNPFGACIEDGVVMDRATVARLPRVRYNACITIEFTFRRMKQPRSVHFVAVRGDRGKVRNDTLIGCLVSPYEAYVKNSKHSKICVSRIGSHYYYLVHFLPKRTNMYENLRVGHLRQGNAIVLVIKGSTEATIGDGSKVANKYGQKNVCSLVTDLSDCWGITRNGDKVHAQIVYSEASLVGRTPSGQLYDMLTSPDLAIGPNGEFLAPVDLVVHTIHPYTNEKLFDIKIDTWTNINGFDSQLLCNTSLALRMRPVYRKVAQVLGLHGYRMQFVHCTRIPFTATANNGTRDDVERYPSKDNDDDDDDDDDVEDETFATSGRVEPHHGCGDRDTAEMDDDEFGGDDDNDAEFVDGETFIEPRNRDDDADRADMDDESRDNDDDEAEDDEDEEDDA